MTTTQRRPAVRVNGVGVSTLVCAMAMVMGGSPAKAATREAQVRPHHAAVAAKAKAGGAAAKGRSAKAGAAKAGAAKAGGQRPATVGEWKGLGRGGAKVAPQAKKRGRRLPEVEDSPVTIYRTSGHAARSASPAVKATAVPAGVPVRQAPAVAASVGVKAVVGDAGVTQAGATGSGGAQTGVFASGQSRPPDDDERLPAQRVVPRAAQRGAPTAAVQSNDPGDAPLEEATVEQRLAGTEEAGDAVGVEARDSVMVSAAAQQTGTAAAALKQLRSSSSHEEMAEDAMQPVVLLGMYRNGRLVVPAPLKGTHEILVHQNLMADEEGLERIRDEEELNRLRASHQLVDLRESEALRVNPELAGNRRCARAWSVRFAEDMARAFYARFRQPLQVNSAVRTVAFQIRLQRVNGNAAPVDGDVASPHLTGQALDFGKRGMSVEQIAWMRSYLLPLMQAGKVDVEEEFQQACFHISVYRAYLQGLPVKRRGVAATEVAQLRSPRGAKVVGAEER